jgi:hypothetical protein
LRAINDFVEFAINTAILGAESGISCEAPLQLPSLLCLREPPSQLVVQSVSRAAHTTWSWYSSKKTSRKDNMLQI